ncbi:methyltransferase domain-containing protein [Thermodesulfobacteriota bacterium]
MDKVEKPNIITRINQSLYQHFDGKVASGPFAGMLHVGDKLKGAGALSPKLIGCYEEELHPVVKGLIEKPYTTIINIGCGEGYYAIGLALMLTNTQIYAFDKNPKAINTCKEMAALNSISDRVEFSTICDTSVLNELAGPEALIFMDCEGCERDLLNLEKVPNLIACDILVELHDYIHSGISDIIKKRFSSSHETEVILSRKRNPDDYPEINHLSWEEQCYALTEFRPDVMEWFYLTAKR